MQFQVLHTTFAKQFHCHQLDLCSQNTLISTGQYNLKIEFNHISVLNETKCAALVILKGQDEYTYLDMGLFILYSSSSYIQLTIVTQIETFHIRISRDGSTNMASPLFLCETEGGQPLAV